MLEVRRLRLLRELSLHGTVAATAEACALTPSAVSQQLSLLEREVRTQLLVRDGRRLRFTEAARILVARTERILAELEHATAEVAALDVSVRGQVHLASFPSVAGSLAAPAIAACREAHPDLRVLLSEREPEECVDGLRNHRIDVALVYEYDLLPRLPGDGVELLPLLREPLLLAVPPGHGRGSGPHALRDFPDERWIAPESDAALHKVLVRACQTAGFDPQLDYTSDDYTVILALVQAGLGVSLLPRLAAEQLTAEVELHPVAGLELTREVSAAVRAGSGTSPAQAALVGALRRAAG